jgi:hypothetical protein
VQQARTQVERADKVGEPAQQTHSRFVGQREWERSQPHCNPSREDLLQVVAKLRQTPPRPEDRLLGKYAGEHDDDMSEESLYAQLHSIATEWEQELDDEPDHA